jgi:hypothetical protein
VVTTGLGCRQISQGADRVDKTNGSCGPTRRSSRPLRARDRWLLKSRFGGALAAAERQSVGRASCRSWLILEPSFWFFCARTPCRSEGQIERGIQARGAGRDSHQCLHTPTHTEARYAGCGSSQRGSTKRRCSCRLGNWCFLPQFGSLWALPPNPPFQPTAARTRSLAF